jgi:Ca2+-binding EF-hand superfamily protein
MLRSLYVWLLRLHPFCFRQRFAGEMLEIFEQTAGRRAVGALFADVFVSLFRQWLLRSEFRQPMLASAVQDTPNTAIFRSLETYKPRPSALLNGAVLSAVVLCAVVVAMGQRGRGRPAFLIGVHHSSRHVFPLDRSSFTESKPSTIVTFGPEPEDPWRALASVYFKVILVLGVLDSDQDLIISPWEIVTAPSALQRLDRDHDGKLSAEECGFSLGADSETVLDPQLVRRARLEFMRANPVLAALDADHDGEISASEMMNSSMALKKLDTNGDGSLTPEELLPDKAANQAAMIFLRLDTNRDGRISSSERASKEAGPLRDLLESADRNHDDATTAKELTNELRFREERRRQYENALRAAGFGPSGPVPLR